MTAASWSTAVRVRRKRGRADARTSLWHMMGAASGVVWMERSLWRFLPSASDAYEATQDLNRPPAFTLYVILERGQLYKSSFKPRVLDLS